MTIAPTRDHPTVAAGPAPPPRPGGDADVAHVLLLLQAGFGIVAAVGLLFFMGSVAHLVVPALHAVALVVLAGAVARGRRWAYLTVVVLEGLSLAGWLLNLAVVVVPELTVTVNLVGLLTGVVLPAALIVLCARCLIRGETR